MRPDPLPVAQVVRYGIAQSYARLVAHEAGVVDGTDPEAVHQARVAIRRLRSDLRTFEPFVEGEWAAELRAELRWIGSELGAVRDLDVMRDRLHRDAARLPAPEAETARRVLRRLETDHAAARSELLAVLHQPRYTELRHRLAAASEDPRVNARAVEDARRALAPLVRRRWRKLARAVERLDVEPSNEALHATRIVVKRCRYAAEASAVAFGTDARRFGRALARVQDVLGEHQDAVVAGEWLAKTAHECSPGEAYVLGMLAASERATAAEARGTFPAVWRRVDRRRRRSWFTT